MKAEHRKELETNVLADRMGKLVETMRTGPKGSVTVWIVIALIAGGIGLGYYLYRSSYTDTSKLWTQLDTAKTPEDLEQIAKDHRGTLPGRTARFEIARIMLAQGVENLGSHDQRASALDKLEKARTMYQELTTDARDMPLLAQEAMMGAAKAEESLSGSPQAENPGQMRGSLDQALQLYQKLADAQPETFQTKAAQERVKQLEDPTKRAKLQEFYVNLNQHVTQKP